MPAPATAAIASASAPGSAGGARSGSESAAEERGERRVCRDHRSCAGRGLEHRLVERRARPRLVRADDEIDGVSSAGIDRARATGGRSATRLREQRRRAAIRRSSSSRCSALVGVSDGPRISSCNVGAAADRERDRVEQGREALPARRATQGEQPQRAVVRAPEARVRSARRRSRGRSRAPSETRAGSSSGRRSRPRRRAASRRAARRPACQCVYQSASGTRRARAQGRRAARTAGPCGRAPRPHHRATPSSARSNRQPRPSFARAPRRSARRRSPGPRPIRRPRATIASSSTRVGERADEIERLCECGVIRIELLRHEDELQARALEHVVDQRSGRRPRSRSPSGASARTSCARPHRDERRAPGRRARGRSPRRARRCRRAGSAARRRPSVAMSGMPPPFVPTTMRPRANASSTTRPSPSGLRGEDERARGVDLAGDLRRQQLSMVLDLAGKLGDEPVDHLMSRALADDGERARPGRRARPCARQQRARRRSCTASSAPTNTTRRSSGTGHERRIAKRATDRCRSGSTPLPGAP